MKSAKDINPIQLQAEAEALSNSTHTHGVSYDRDTGRVWCFGMSGEGDEVCQSLKDALVSHTATPIPPRLNPEQELVQAMADHVQNNPNATVTDIVNVLKQAAGL